MFAIAGAERIAAYPDDGAVALSGGPEGVLSLADAGLLDGRAVMGTIDAEAADAADDAEATDEQPLSTLAEAGTGSDEDAVVQTDTQRRRAYNPGADPGRRYSATLSAADPLPRPDLGPYDAAEQAVSVLEGASNVKHTQPSQARDGLIQVRRGLVDRSQHPAGAALDDADMTSPDPRSETWSVARSVRAQYQPPGRRRRILRATRASTSSRACAPNREVGLGQGQLSGRRRRRRGANTCGLSGSMTVASTDWPNSVFRRRPGRRPAGCFSPRRTAPATGCPTALPARPAATGSAGAGPAGEQHGV